eukprot:CFRG4732T1
MVHIDTQAVLNLPAAEFWSIRNTEEFLAIECKYLNNASKYCLSEKIDPDTGMVEHQKLATKPDLSVVPPFLLKLLPGDDGLVFYDDVNYTTEDPTTPFAFTATTTPSVFSDKADIVGYVRVVPSSDNRTCTQIVSMDVNVSQWGMGSIVESIVSNGIHNGYKLMPAMVEDWKKSAADMYSKNLNEHFKKDKDKWVERRRSKEANWIRSLRTSSTGSLDSWAWDDEELDEEEPVVGGSHPAMGDDDSESLYSNDSLYFDPDDGSLDVNSSSSGLGVDSAIEDEIGPFPLKRSQPHEHLKTITPECTFDSTLRVQQPKGIEMRMSIQKYSDERDACMRHDVGTDLFHDFSPLLSWMVCGQTLVPSCFVPSP